MPTDLAALHARARAHKVNPRAYAVLRLVLQPAFHVYFRLRRVGHEHVPDHGPVILAANHRSFLDPFVIATVSRRPLYYVAKRELFARPGVAWVLGRLGAFPVSRGTGDAEMLSSARA